MPDAKTHKVIATEVVKIKGDTYGVIFTYDDGTEDYAEAGSNEAAKFYCGNPSKREHSESAFPSKADMAKENLHTCPLL